MKKSNSIFFKINFLQFFVIILIFVGFLYIFNMTQYKESIKTKSNPCSAVADDDRCNKRNDCTWFKGQCTNWQWRGMKRTCTRYSTQYCKDK